MNTYELMVIYPETLKETNVKKHISELKEKIESLKGKILNEDYWGLKHFAYEMKKETSGYYDVFLLEIEPDQIDELSKWMKLQDESILRTMVTKK